MNYRKIAVLGLTMTLMAGAATAQKVSQETMNAVKANQETMLKNQEEIMKLQKQSAGNVDLSKDLDKTSYAIGVNMADNLMKQGLDEWNSAAILQGMLDAMNPEDLKMSPNDAAALLQSYMQQLRAIKAEKAKAVGQEFLAANKTKPGVITTASGLQYIVINEGAGAKPSPADKVTTHYHGTLLDGTVFDSSVDRGEPIQFGVGQVIKGWTEALQLMSPGAKYKLFIPYDLAYGERGAGGTIGAYETLIFEVELLSVDK